MKIGSRYIRMRKQNLKWFPELLRFETIDQRNAALHDAAKSSFNPKNILYILMVIAAWLGFRAVGVKSIPAQMIPYAVLASYGVIVSFAVWQQRRTRQRIHRRLRELLNQRGIKTCVACGYDMRGIELDICPECGQPIVDAIEI